MRKTLFSLGLCCLFLGFSSNGICQNTTFETAKHFLETGDLHSFCGKLDDVVLVDIYGKSNYYSKKQAGTLITAFFTEHPVTKFSILSIGGNRSSNFGIGRMKSGNTNYRITCSVSSEKNKTFSIHRIKIEIDD